eukprot:sb/3477091/
MLALKENVGDTPVTQSYSDKHDTQWYPYNWCRTQSQMGEAPLSWVVPDLEVSPAWREYGRNVYQEEWKRDVEEHVTLRGPHDDSRTVEEIRMAIVGGCLGVYGGLSRRPFL